MKKLSEIVAKLQERLAEGDGHISILCYNGSDYDLEIDYLVEDKAKVLFLPPENLALEIA